MARKREHIDVGHLIDVICQFTQEEYPLQRYVAILTFSTWLVWPFAIVVEYGETAAIARVILEISRGRIKVPKDSQDRIIGGNYSPLST
jgi:hypothetical protein